MSGDRISAAAAGSWRLGERVVRRMGFGTMRLTANPDRAVAVAVLRRAVELGVNHLDTAAFYVTPGGIIRQGEGPARYATELIREALAPYPEDLVIATKVGPGIDGDGTFYQATSGDQLRRQVEENLRRLGVERLDLVNLRIIKKAGADSVAERFGALAAMREEGLIAQLGLSNVRADHVEEASAIAPVACVQNSYGIDVHRDDDALVARCGELGIAYVPFFAIAGNDREKGAVSAHGDSLTAVAEARGATPQQVRLAWTLHQGPHVLAIPGTGSLAHLEENVAAGALQLTPDEVAALGRSSG
jgi:pyridoxine 4-dehydrogenase